MSEEKIAAVLSSVDELKGKGVTGIKIELEAQMFRNRSTPQGGDGEDICDDCDDDGEVRCDTCDGEGETTCSRCDGRGRVDVPRSSISTATPVTTSLMSDLGLLETETATCDRCDGLGDIPCNNCDSHGYVDCPNEVHSEERTSTDWRLERSCFNWLMDKIAEKTESQRRGPTTSNGQPNPFPWMRYARFYNDGSVDSELTATIKLDNPENVLFLPKLIEAFKELGDAIGQGFEVSGAGMHTALIFSSDCSYPTDSADHPGQATRLPETHLRNFKRSVTQLLPALYFLGASDGVSRGLRYRLPFVSVDFRADAYSLPRGPKYSAVTYRQGAIEFRIFDTCYEKPDVSLDNVVVIANCMRYMQGQYRSPGIDKIVKQISFGNETNSRLDRFYETEQMLDVLDIGIEAIKPPYLTVDEVKQQRQFSRTKHDLANLEQEHQKHAETEYEEYEERFEWEATVREMSIKAQLASSFIATCSASKIKSLSQEDIDKIIEPRLKAEMQAYRNRKAEKENYINSRLESWKHARNGQHKLVFA